MRLMLLFSALFLFAGNVKSQSCCEPGAMDIYARNGSSNQFKSAHELPRPYVHVSETGKDINFKTPDGKDAHGWFLPAKNKSPYFLFVIHEWWGLNDHIKRESEKYWNDLGINVLAIDLYDGVVATTREEAGKTMQSVTPERAESIIRGAYGFAGAEAKVFTVGWCFGGGWSLQTGLLGGKQLAGTLMYYGQPEKDVEKLKTLNADVIGFFGTRDQWPSVQVVNEFKENMAKAGEKLYLHMYDAEHAFANPSNPNFNEAATKDSYQKSIAFIKERMK